MPDTIYREFAVIAARLPDAVALMHKVGGRYRSITFSRLARMVDEVAAGLARRGVRPGTSVAIYSYNRPEWVVADLAVIKLGGVVVPVYHTLPEEAVRYILGDAGVQHVIVESPDLFGCVTRVMDGLPDLRDVVTLFRRDGESRSGKELLCLESLRAEGAAALAADPGLGAAHDGDPDDVVTVAYTSGTTGEPKGAMLTHRNILSNVRAAIARFGVGERDRLVSFLPLCHMFERTCGYYTMLLAGASIAYAESLDTIREDVRAARPTLLIVVPRVLEKVYNTVVENVNAGSAMKRRLMRAALRTGSRCSRARRQHRPIPLGLRFRRWLLGLLVVRRLHALAGGRVRLIFSGGAPLDRRLARLVRDLGFNLLEGYGLTETSPVVCASVPGEERVGTVGRPFPGVEVRIAPDQEILVRGPNVMKGYLNKPEETARAIDGDGWFHTGDLGRFDDAGNLVITGRIKEIIVTAYGKNVAPVPIEQALVSSEYIEQALVVGDRRPYLTALLVPGRLAVEEFARSHGASFAGLDDLLSRPDVTELYRGEVERALARFAPFEQVRAFTLVAEPFTVENGLLTPSFKLRRPGIECAYRQQVDRMYREH